MEGSLLVSAYLDASLRPFMWPLLTILGFCHEHALILYVYLPSDGGEDESVLTVSSQFANLEPYLTNLQYYISSYSA